ncbi:MULTISPECIES: anthranilate synthase component I [unclassified Carboxydocella]|uniref:anthranilate synthase component I n=1 Tax=unclassified Carboxydocella TaxID=2685367 RepID=UPI0009D23A8C|nr:MULTISPECIES: anthranilate synthase component I [unclassified Carboxydocella]GAW27517.1 aminobenzoate synthetase [Carboxydocella sp. ULO1]GAW32373.1 aminobenzoate synthetase [Carboxydocella sp. JDF658]
MEGLIALFFPTRDEFKKLQEKGYRIPVGIKVPLHGLSPLQALDKLNLEGKPAVLLESGKGTEKYARYSFLGWQPWLVYRAQGERITVYDGNGQIIREYQGHPYEELRQLLKLYPAKRYPGLPKFCGGAMGFISYDMGRYFERMPELTIDDLGMPEAYFMLVDRLLVFDHWQQTLTVIVNVLEQDYHWALAEIEAILRDLENNPARPAVVLPENKELKRSFVPEANMTQAEFEAMVVKCKEYIKAGDIFQANLSIRLCREIHTHPLNLYRIVREVNPSPYMAYLEFGDWQIVSSSPELLVRINEEGYAETRPIAGTRRRGANREEDLALARELISNEKERAEHIMLVDLERNDLGRVCQYGTVEVNELMVIEEYSHVMHIVSNVRGRLAPGKDGFDLLRAAFPGGTITGAPKIRSMEIIEELEPTRRGIYTGSIGYFGYAGEMEMNIVIRTLVIKDGKKAYVQAGAGIVADSIPEREYFESLKKAEALLKTLELAEELFAREVFHA